MDKITPKKNVLFWIKSNQKKLTFVHDQGILGDSTFLLWNPKLETDHTTPVKPKSVDLVIHPKPSYILASDS